jgi:hypothetical protein
LREFVGTGAGLISAGWSYGVADIVAAGPVIDDSFVAVIENV